MQNLINSVLSVIAEETPEPTISDRAYASGRSAYMDSEKSQSRQSRASDHAQAAKSHRVASIMHGVAANHIGFVGGDEAKRSYHFILAKHHEDLQRHHETLRTK